MLSTDLVLRLIDWVPLAPILPVTDAVAMSSRNRWTEGDRSSGLAGGRRCRKSSRSLWPVSASGAWKRYAGRPSTSTG